MSYNVTITTEPASEPITLSELKAHSRVDTDADDTYLTDLIVAARKYAEHYTGRAIEQQTVTMTTDGFINRLPHMPLVSVTSIKYYAPAASTRTTLSTADYTVSPGLYGGLTFEAGLPSIAERPDAVEYVYVTGEASDKGTKQAIKIIAAHYYENRELTGGNTKPVPWSTHSLLDRLRYGSGY